MEIVRSIYSAFIYLGNQFSHLLLLAVRLYWGVGFFFAGTAKLQDIQGTSDYFQSLNIPFPLFHSYAVGCLELIGGLLLILGLASRVTGLALAIMMLCAFWLGHRPEFLAALQDPEAFLKQAPFNFLLASLIVFSFGPGAFSLDALIKRSFKVK